VVLAGAGGKPISRTNANALAAEGNAGEDYCAGGVIGIGGNPHPCTAGRGLVTQPVGEGGDLGGGVVALEQFGQGLGQRISRRCGGREQHRDSSQELELHQAGCSQQQARNTTDRTASA